MKLAGVVLFDFVQKSAVRLLEIVILVLCYTGYPLKAPLSRKRLVHHHCLDNIKNNINIRNNVPAEHYNV